VQFDHSRKRRSAIDKVEIRRRIGPFVTVLLFGVVMSTISLFSVPTTDLKTRCKLISQTTERAAIATLGKPTQSAVSGDPPRHWDDWRFSDVDYEVRSAPTYGAERHRITLI
jgi:hypothetical protein